MRRLLFTFLFSGLFVVSGCAEPAGSGTTQTDGTAESSEGAAEKPAPLKTATEDANTDSQDVAMTEPPGDTTSSADSSTSEPAAETAARETPPNDADQPPVEVDPLVAGLEFPNVNIAELMNTTKSEYAANSKDPKAISKYVSLCYQLGMIHDQQDNRQQSHDAFLRAGEIVQKGIDDGIELDPDMKAAIFFKLAKVEATTGKPEAALASIEKAVDNGFTQLAELKDAEDLASVRELSGFSEKLAAWEVKVRELILAEVKHELEQNTPFPFDFTLTNAVSGEPVALADYKGKVCIVDIWGTWCPPCREEIPSFIKLQDKLGESGFQMIGLNQESGADEEAKLKKVTDYISSAGINYPCALLNEELLDQVPDFGGFPTTLFLDRSGTVRLKAVGLHDYEYLEAVVETLLAESANP